MTATFLDLPDEVLICIARHTEIVDVLSLRKTCRRCFNLTHERSIWETILLDQSTLYPIPRAPHRGLQLSNTDNRDIEALATSVYTTAVSWLHKRPNTLSLQPDVLSEWHSGSGALARLDHRSIQDMHMLLDRWLVVVFQEGCYELWDLYPDDADAGCAGLSPNGSWGKKRARVRPVCVLQERVHGAFISSAACVDPEDEAIVLALSSQPVIMVVKINVKTKHLQPELVASVGTTPFSIYTMRAISPTSKLLVFGFALNLHFWHWPTDSYWEVKLDENEDEIYNMVIATHFLTPRHLLCLLNSSVELLTLDFLHELNDVPSSQTQNNKTLRMDSLNFRGRRHPHCMQLPHPNPVDLVTVRGAVFSEPKMVFEEDEGGAMCRTTFLAYNVLRGLFHYGVEVRFSLESVQAGSPSPSPSASASESASVTHEFTSPPLDFTLNLLAAHHMAQYVPSSSSSSSSSNTDPPPTTSQLQSVSGYTPQGGTRGFISTCALGSQGMRGIWVERHRTSMGRSVFGFAARDYTGAFGADTQAEAESTAKMSSAERSTEKPYAAIASTCIHEMKSSYDLRGGLPDDLTHCALSEVTGSVVLGTRRGELIVL